MPNVRKLYEDNLDLFNPYVNFKGTSYYYIFSRSSLTYLRGYFKDFSNTHISLAIPQNSFEDTYAIVTVDKTKDVFIPFYCANKGLLPENPIFKYHCFDLEDLFNMREVDDFIYLRQSVYYSVFACSRALCSVCLLTI